MQHRCHIACRLPRGRCEPCRGTWRVLHAWEGKAGGFTKKSEAFALVLMRGVPIKKAAEALAVTNARMWRPPKCHVEAAREDAYFSQVTQVGVEEISIRRGHRYIGVFGDMGRRRVLFSPEGKDAGVWPASLGDLEAHNGHRHGIVHVSRDMSFVCLKGVRDPCRNPEVV